jgi:hypothetical protein
MFKSLISLYLKEISESKKRQLSLGANNNGFNAGYNHQFSNGVSANVGVSTNNNLKPTGWNAGISIPFGKRVFINYIHLFFFNMIS